MWNDLPSTKCFMEIAGFGRAMMVVRVFDVVAIAMTKNPQKRVQRLFLLIQFVFLRMHCRYIELYLSTKPALSRVSWTDFILTKAAARLIKELDLSCCEIRFAIKSFEILTDQFRP